MTLYMWCEIYSPWWRHQMEAFSALLAICAGYSPVPVNSPHRGQRRGALMFSLICVWINDWANNNEAGDLIRYRAHYDVIVMQRGNSHEIMPPYLTWPIAHGCCAEKRIHTRSGLSNCGPQHIICQEHVIYLTYPLVALEYSWAAKLTHAWQSSGFVNHQVISKYGMLVFYLSFNVSGPLSFTESLKQLWDFFIGPGNVEW